MLCAVSFASIKDAWRGHQQSAFRTPTVSTTSCGLVWSIVELWWMHTMSASGNGKVDQNSRDGSAKLPFFADETDA